MGKRPASRLVRKEGKCFSFNDWHFQMVSYEPADGVGVHRYTNEAGGSAHFAGMLQDRPKGNTNAE